MGDVLRRGFRGQRGPPTSHQSSGRQTGTSVTEQGNRSILTQTLPFLDGRKERSPVIQPHDGQCSSLGGRAKVPRIPGSGRHTHRGNLALAADIGGKATRAKTPSDTRGTVLVPASHCRLQLSLPSTMAGDAGQREVTVLRITSRSG